MMPLFFVIVGWVSSILAIGMYLPQTIKIVRSKSTKSISVTTFLVVTFGSLLWATYLSMNPNALQGYIANFIIVIFMTPIIWFLVKNSIPKLFIYFIMVSTLVLTIVFQFISISFPVAGNIIMVICAGSMTGLGFIPQVYSSVKARNSGDTSLYMMLLIFISQILGVIYWIGIFQSSLDNQMISNVFGLSFTLLSGLLQIPLLWLKLARK